jgi:phosphatidylserine/phosphatidylglycerophosphate/cardiolipin synthase-like enzyme
VSLAFDGASAAMLRALGAALLNGQLVVPLSPLAISRVAPSAGAGLTEELVRLSREGMRPDHMALLLDAMARGVESHLASRAELVWTGPESSYAQSRDTAVVVSELFKSATRSVLVSTLMIKQPDKVFGALAARMAEVPGLKVQIFAHVGRGDRDTRHDSEILREYASWLSGQWPGRLRPALYYDPRSLDIDFERRATWHAKVVVIDDEVSFVTSANFTEWAHQRNVEAGALIRSTDFARQLRHQFEALIQSHAVLEVPGFRSA